MMAKFHVHVNPMPHEGRLLKRVKLEDLDRFSCKRLEGFPREFWNEEGNQRTYFDWLAEQLNIDVVNRWYSVKQTDILTTSGTSLVNNYFGGSQSKALVSVYPDTQWLPWLFDQVPGGFWEDLQNHREYFDWLADQLGAHSITDVFYNITRAEITKSGGSGLMRMYGNSLYLASRNVYPEVTWQPWKLESLPKHTWEEEKNQREYMDWLGEELHLQRTEDWYTVKNSDLERRGASTLISVIFEDSLNKALQCVFPDTTWHPWKFAQVSAEIWKDPSLQFEYCDWLGLQLEFSTLQDWYRIIPNDLADHGGGPLLALYKYNTYLLLENVFSHESWQPWRFEVSPFGMWTTPGITRRYFDWLAEDLELTMLDEWYKLRPNECSKRFGGILLTTYYDNSVFKALRAAYPHSQLHFWKFENSVDAGACWELPARQLEFMEWLADELQLQEMEEWYRIHHATVHSYGGGPLLEYYSGSLLQTLKCLYPSNQWVPWRFTPVPHWVWRDLTVLRDFFDFFGELYQLKYASSWYQVNKGYVVHEGGEGILSHEESLMDALATVYPDTTWHRWKFRQVPKSFWDQPANRREYLDYLEEKLDIGSPKDWCGFTFKHAASFQGTSLLYFSGGLKNLLQERYPDYLFDWDQWQTMTHSKSQIFLSNMVKEVLPHDVEITSDYMCKFIPYQNRKSMQFDIWLPKYNVCLEHQGLQHYEPDAYFVSDYIQQIQKDLEKRNACNNEGITVVSIPHWWDFKSTSLAATLSRSCPIAISSEVDLEDPIPTSMTIANTKWLYEDQLAISL